MPAQPAWFHRLDQILADLRALGRFHSGQMAASPLFSNRSPDPFGTVIDPLVCTYFMNTAAPVFLNVKRWQLQGSSPISQPPVGEALRCAVEPPQSNRM